MLPYKKLIEVLEFYAEEATYQARPYFRSCESDWHTRLHSYHSTCPNCSEHVRRGVIQGFLNPRIEIDRGEKARELLSIINHKP